jgi:activating signal cointegrator complex subunit 3
LFVSYLMKLLFLRCRRPQFDTSGVAVILCQEEKKNFYRKFLYEPFPVESQLCTEKGCLADHLNAEIAGGSIRSRRDAVEFLSWTYFYRRLEQNPAFYGLEDCSSVGVQAFLYRIVDDALASLQESCCVLLGDGAAAIADSPVADAVAPTTLGRIASFYYLQHRTAGLLLDRIGRDNSAASLLRLLCDSHEFDELPVRHNEEILNAGLSLLVPWSVEPPDSFSSPHSKAFL